jgi:hypothetical protein
MSVLYLRLPSYITLAQYFSLEPNPVIFFAQKQEKKDIKNGNFVDIYDIGGVSPKDYNILITDINNDILDSKISKFIGILYLKEVKGNEADNMPYKLTSFIYGDKFHLILLCLIGI